jgi:hypothetical protein
MRETIFDRLRDASRASPLLVIFLITFAIVALMAPVKVGLTLFGISKLALGAYVGYWADRLCFREENRPHRLQGIAQGTAWKRRAIIVAASILAAALIP